MTQIDTETLDKLVATHRSKIDGTVHGAFHRETADVIEALRAKLVDACSLCDMLANVLDGQNPTEYEQNERKYESIVAYNAARGKIGGAV